MRSGDYLSGRRRRFRLLTERASVGLFGLGDIRGQVRIIRDALSVDERPVVDAFVGISSALYAAQHAGGATASRRDLEVLDQVTSVVSAVSDALAERFALPAVQMAATSPVPAVNAGIAVATHLWKPLGLVWTAPLVEPASAWALWAAETGNAKGWERQIRYDTPAAASRVVVDSLETADKLVGGSTFLAVAHNLERAGIERVDFSWRCVLEAECAALRGERAATSFPCALGTESSIWLTTPAPASQREYKTTPDKHAP
ncbi:MAG: hypothetical protein F4X18_01115 [Acidimicrobiia bacterium]|nr:hypothetical protein [Acidimicrobiia bacterium]